MARLSEDRFVGTGGGVIPPLTANVGMRYGLRDGRGYDYPTEQRYDDLWRRAVVKPDPLGLTLPSTQTTTSPAALHAMGLLAVKWILSPKPLNLREVYRGPDGHVYENPFAVPRTFVVGTALNTNDQLGVVTRPGFDPTTVAAVSQPLELSGSGTARIARDDPEHVTVRADVDNGRALVVLADTFFPGWKATVDGEDVPIVRTDHLLRGVVVGRGAHVIEFRYAPWSWRVGWIVSLLTAAALAALAWRRQ